jgi:hypothetical protein
VLSAHICLHEGVHSFRMGFRIPASILPLGIPLERYIRNIRDTGALTGSTAIAEGVTWRVWIVVVWEGALRSCAQDTASGGVAR